MKLESASQPYHVREALGQVCLCPLALVCLNGFQANSPTTPFASYPTALPGIYSSQPASASQAEGLSGLTAADCRLSANVSDPGSPLMETILERQRAALASSKQQRIISSRSVSQGSSNTLRSVSPLVKSEDMISKRRHISMDAVIEHQRISENGKVTGSQGVEVDSSKDMDTSNSISVSDFLSLSRISQLV